MWFKRPEFDRYARFHSHGSAREIFDWEEMCNVTLPKLWKYLYSCGRMFCYENSSTGLKNFDLEGFLQEENIFIPDEITAQEFNNICPLLLKEQIL